MFIHDSQVWLHTKILRVESALPVAILDNVLDLGNIWMDLILMSTGQQVKDENSHWVLQILQKI